jgi:serpin B
MAIAMTYNGAASTTKKAISQTMSFAPLTEQELNESFKSLSGLLTGIDKQVTFTSANSIWHSNQIALQPAFTGLNREFFDAEIKGLNFSDSGSPAVINTWVKEKTKGKIEEIVESIRPDQLLFLINAIYFKGAWTYQFDKKLTQDASFQLADGSSSTVKMMALKNASYSLYQDNSKTVVDLPYGNKQYSMTLIIPVQNKQIPDIEQEVTDENLTTWLKEANASSLDLYMPKFTLDYELQLKETLIAMGMGEAFSDQADLSRMVEGVSKGIAIGDVKHKTFIEVNEEGTEAAAVTSVDIVVTSMPPAVYVNKPFLFMIREKSTGTVLFIGKIMNPA